MFLVDLSFVQKLWEKNEFYRTETENGQKKTLLELYQQHHATIPLLIAYELLCPFGFYLIPDV